MGIFDVKKLLSYEKNQICITVNELYELEIIKNYRVDVAIKINIGMNRFGLRMDELAYVDWSLPNIVGVYGHIARDEVKEFADFTGIRISVTISFGNLLKRYGYMTC